MLIRILLLVILIGINGLLSASEIAYLSLDKYSIAKKRDKKSKKIMKMLINYPSWYYISRISCISICCRLIYRIIN